MMVTESAATGPEIHVLQLYPRDMNIYGDYGNALVMKRRLQWAGYSPVMRSYDPGDEFPERVDILLGGGGQDSGQDKIQQDLLRIAPKLHSLAEAETPMLVICGLYQLFGHAFHTRTGAEIKGISILDVTTYGTDERLIGNVVSESPEFGQILGYENHSGQTYLGSGVNPLAEVNVGAGNNATDHHEGARAGSVIGSYLHGSLLPKNPALADYLITTAITRRMGDDAAAEAKHRLTGIDSATETPMSLSVITDLARKKAAQRPR